jgi:hypothetical protein
MSWRTMHVASSEYQYGDDDHHVVAVEREQQEVAWVVEIPC